MTETTFETKCEILTEFNNDYCNYVEWQDFIKFHNLGFPVAYIIHYGIMSSTPKAEYHVENTWQALLKRLDFDDVGFESYDEFVDAMIEDEVI